MPDNAAETTAEELVLFTDNEGDLNRNITTSIHKNLMTKRGQGRYDHELAVQAFMYLAEAGARKYARVHGSGEHEWNLLFPIEARRLAATHWRNSFETEADLGNYDHYLPKKYQRASSRKQTLRPATHRLRSTAYLSGQKDARKWIRSADPSASVLRVLIARDPTTMNPSQELHQNESTARVAKKLGVTVKSVQQYDARFNHFVKEYDAGYLQVCQQVLAAMEGN